MRDPVSLHPRQLLVLSLCFQCSNRCVVISHHGLGFAFL